MNVNLFSQTILRQKVPACLLSATIGAVLLTGCTSTSQIVANDARVNLPSVRVAVNLGEPKQAISEPQSGRAVEFGFVKTKGSGYQDLTAGQAPIVLGNKTFSSPQHINTDFDFNYADLSFRWRKFFGERALGIEVGGGIGHASIGLNVFSPTQRATQDYSTYGPQGGVALIWRMRPSTSLHARISGFVSKSSTGISDFGRYEIFFAQALGDNLAVRAGYAKWEVNGNGNVGQSDFRTTFSGPILDLGLNF